MKGLRRFVFYCLLAMPLSSFAQWEIGAGGNFSLPLGEARNNRLWGSGVDLSPMYEFYPNILAGLYTGLSYYQFAYEIGGDKIGLRSPLMAQLRIYFTDIRMASGLYISMAGGGLIGYTHYYNKASNLTVETPWDTEWAIGSTLGYNYYLSKWLSFYSHFQYTLRYYNNESLQSTEKYHLIAIHAGLQWHIGRNRP